MKVSTGIRNHLLVTGTLKAALDGGVIRIYGATTSQAAADALIPATADASIGTAVLLATISNNGAGTGINLDTTAASGVISKAAAEVWKGTRAAGYPSFARFSALADTGAESTVEKRLQMTVGVLGKEIIVSSSPWSAGDEQRIDQFYVGVPGE